MEFKLITLSKLRKFKEMFMSIINTKFDEVNQTINNEIADVNTAINGKADSEHVHNVATTEENGFMSSEDKVKLDNVTTYTAGNGIIIKDGVISIVKKEKRGEPYFQHFIDKDGNDMGGVYIGGKLYTEDDFDKIDSAWVAKKVSTFTYTDPEVAARGNYIMICQDYTTGEVKTTRVQVYTINGNAWWFGDLVNKIATDENGTASAYWLNNSYFDGNSGYTYYHYIDTNGEEKRERKGSSTNSYPCRWVINDPYFFSD